MVDQLSEEELAPEEEAVFEVVEQDLGTFQPRSFASLMGESETDEEPEIVDESLLVRSLVGVG